MPGRNLKIKMCVVYMCKYVCLHICRPAVNIKCLSHSLPAFVFWQGLPVNQELTDRASDCKDPSISAPMLEFYLWAVVTTQVFMVG